jgi:hypothetical protein
VQISGNNFAAGATVMIGDAPASEVVVNSPTTISAKTPARSSTGPVDVTVNVAGKVATLGGGFTYTENPAAPVIDSITARGSKPGEPAGFADIGEDIVVTAAVSDPDTPVEQLQFQWTADVGTFSGSGATVTWRAPADAEAPRSVTLSLTVSDGAGSASSTASVSLHDSIKEVGGLARDFLLDFSNSSNPPAFVVRNFSKSPRCEAERDDEFSQIERNRQLYDITSSSIGAASVTIQFASRPCAYEPRNGDACAVIPATWNSVCITSDPACIPGKVEGVDYVTAVFEQSQWRLCASYFEGRQFGSRTFIR